MASELRVDTLKDSSGNNSIGMSTVASGAVKSFINMNGSGTPAIVDSLNMSSLADNATGKYTPTMTNAMSTSTYGGTTGSTGADSSANSTSCTALFQSTRTTTTFSMTSARFGGSAASYVDETHNSCSLNGDLA